MLKFCDNVKMHGQIIVTVVVLLLIASNSTSWARYLGPNDSLTEGKFNKCSNEGEEVNVAQNPCFHCICRKGQVECDYAACPSLKGCHAILFMKTPGTCCDKCKGCSVNNTNLAHGEVKTDVKNPCDVMVCQAGVLTKSRDICNVPCSNPLHVPGQCCPSCRGCSFEGKKYKEGQKFTSVHDSGLECVCSGGNITCTKRVCPVLNCPSEYLYKVPGQKCPQCKGQRRVYTLRESCYFARQVYDHGDVTMMDSCTSCVCQQGTMFCERQQCPEMRCPPSERVYTQGECCPKCRQRPSCISGGRVYQHGKKWRERHCTDCLCDNGKKWCHAVTCPRVESCPLGHLLMRKDGECCEKCVKDEKTCSVTGPYSDVFKTLDGRRYNMSAPACEHTLLKDCYQHQFHIKIRYKQKQQVSRPSLSFVSIALGKNRVKLYRNFKVRINKSKLTSRRYSKSRTLYVRINFPIVIVQDKKTGIRVIWNMVSGLKVKVDRRYRKSGRLCGLCGNFNGHKRDDFINDKGKLLKSPSQMSSAWSRKKTCAVDARKKNNKTTLEKKNISGKSGDSIKDSDNAINGETSGLTGS